MFVQTFPNTVEDTWLSNLEHIITAVAEHGQGRVGFSLKNTTDPEKDAQRALELFRNRLEPMNPYLKAELLRIVRVSDKICDVWFEVSVIG